MDCVYRSMKLRRPSSLLHWERNPSSFRSEKLRVAKHYFAGRISIISVSLLYVNIDLVSDYFVG
jgi:hypothetical protein